MSSLEFAHIDLVVSVMLKLLVRSRLLKLVQNDAHAICLEFPKNQLGSRRSSNPQMAYIDG